MSVTSGFCRRPGHRGTAEAETAHNLWRLDRHGHRLDQVGHVTQQTLPALLDAHSAPQRNLLVLTISLVAVVRCTWDNTCLLEGSTPPILPHARSQDHCKHPCFPGVCSMCISRPYGQSHMHMVWYATSILSLSSPGSFFCGHSVAIEGLS